MSFAVAQYQNVRVETASPLRLVIDLYQGAIRFMRTAVAAHQRGDHAARGNALSRAHAIVSELSATLDHERAPELCEELERLYDYVLHCITEANVRADGSLAEPAISVMQTLESAWVELDGRVR